MTKRNGAGSTPAPKRSRGRSLTTAERRANGLELVQGLWLPAELVRRLDASGTTRTAAVLEALERWLTCR